MFVNFLDDLTSEFEMVLSSVDDSDLTPSQRRHWDAMEAKQAAREQLQRDAESKALRERADSLAEAGRAMDLAETNHDHRMGWAK